MTMIPHKSENSEANFYSVLKQHKLQHSRESGYATGFNPGVIQVLISGELGNAEDAEG